MEINKKPTEPGLPALVRKIKSSWARVEYKGKAITEYQNININYVAITLEKAAEIWGYGRVLTTVDSTPQTFTDLVAFRKANAGSPWFQNQRDILKAEVVSRTGQPRVRVGIAAELGISVTQVGNLITKEYEPKRVQPLKLKSVRS